MFIHSCLACVVLIMNVLCPVSCCEIDGAFDDAVYSEIFFQPVMDVATKAPLTSFPNSRTMQVVARFIPDGTVNTGSAVNYFPATTYTYSTTNGYASSSGNAVHYWPLDNTGTLNFLAYSTALSVTGVTWGSDYSRSVSFTTPDNSTTQDDILIGSRKGATRTASNGSRITFKHAQALVSFKASSTVAYSSSDNVGITITGITMNAAAHQGTFSATRNTRSGNGVFTAQTWTTSTSNNKNNITVPGSTTARNLTATSQSLGTGIMMPTQSASGQYVVISYTLHNGKNASNANLDIPMTYRYDIDGTSWLPGNQYVYDFSFSLNDITVTANVTDWGDGGTYVYPKPPAAMEISYNDIDFGDNEYITVTCNAYEGTVTLKLDNEVFDTKELLEGRAVFVLSGLAVGSHTVTVTYNGGPVYGVSTESVTFNVSP